MISLFDIIGPVMVGPSSSHTAGACRMGLFARRLLAGQPGVRRSGGQAVRRSRGQAVPRTGGRKEDRKEFQLDAAGGRYGKAMWWR